MKTEESDSLNTDGIITSRGDGRPFFSLVEFSFVMFVFAFVLALMAILFYYPRDWKADDESNKEKTRGVMAELYTALLQYSSEYNGKRFPPEIDNFLHSAPLEWRRLGICPASNRRFSIQLIPGWTLADIETHPTELLAYDYDEDELRYKDINNKKFIIDEKLSEANGAIEERFLTREEMWAILANRIEDVPPAMYKNSNQLHNVRSQLLREGTMGRNFADGYMIMTLDGTIKFVDDSEFCRYRMRVFHRELVNQAKENDGQFPKDAATAVVNMVLDEKSWWLKNSIGICPSDSSFIGFTMPQARISLTDPPDTILLYNSRPEIFKGRNVLFLDGTVKFMSELEFQNLRENISNVE